MKTTLHIVFLALVTAATYAQTTYFLVAPINPALRTDSYVLPLTNPNDIAHARDLIQYGIAAERPIAVAGIACGPDSINRNFYSPSKTAWNWYITEFHGFADFTAEILDGNPNFVNNDCYAWCQNTNSIIGFWAYTVVAELGLNPKPWEGNLNKDKAVNMADMNLFARYWNSTPCTDPLWCGNADINHDGFVDLLDLERFANTWLTDFPDWPVWFEAWECPTQCYGDANCTADGGIIKYHVSTPDLAMYMAVWGSKPWPIHCGDFNYNPAIDFDRDCDIDETDGAILETWYHRTDVPADCPTAP